jgi:hypothetical protein
MSSLELSDQVNVEKQFSIPGVEMFGLINKHGKLIDWWGKKDIMLSKSKKEMFLMQIALHNSMQCDFNEDLGCVNFCVVQREKMKFICFPMTEDRIAVAVIDKKTNYASIINRIRRLCTTSLCNQTVKRGFAQK